MDFTFKNLLTKDIHITHDDCKNSPQCVGCEQLRRKFKEVQQTVSSRDVIIEMLQNQLRKFENLYKNSLDDTEKLRYKYFLTVQELDNFRDISKTLEQGKGVRGVDNCLDTCENQNIDSDYLKTWRTEYQDSISKLKAIEAETLSQITTSDSFTPSNVENLIKKYSRSMRELLKEVLEQKKLRMIERQERQKPQKPSKPFKVSKWSRRKRFNNSDRGFITTKDVLKLNDSSERKNADDRHPTSLEKFSNHSFSEQEFEEPIAKKTVVSKQFTGTTPQSEKDYTFPKRSISILKIELFNDSNEGIEKVQDEKEQMKKKIHKLETSNELLNKTINDLTLENQSNSKKLSDVNDKLAATLMEFKSCEHNLNERISSYKAKIEILQQALRENVSENQTTTSTTKIYDISLLEKRNLVLLSQIQMLQDQNNVFETENKAIKEQLNQNKQEIFQLKEKVVVNKDQFVAIELYTEIKQKWQNNDEELAELEKYKEDLLSKISKLNEKLEMESLKYDNKVKSLNEQLTTIENEKLILHYENQNLRGKFTIKPEGLAEYEQEIENLKDEIDKMESAMDLSKRDITTLKLEIKQYESDKLQLQYENSDLKGKINDFKGSSQHQYLNEIKDLKELINKMKNENASYMKEIVTLKEENLQYKNQTESLRELQLKQPGEIQGDLREEIYKIRNEKTKFINEIKALRENVAKKEIEIQLYKTDIHNLKEQLKHASFFHTSEKKSSFKEKDQASDDSNSIKALKLEIDDYRSVILDLMVEIDSLKEIISKSKDETLQCNLEMEHLKDEMKKKAECDNEEVVVNSNKSTLPYDSYEKDMKRLKVETKNCEEEKRTMLQQVIDLRQRIKTLLKNADETTNILNTQKTVIQELEEQLSNLDEKCMKIQERYNELEVNNENLEEKFKILTQKNEILKKFYKEKNKSNKAKCFLSRNPRNSANNAVKKHSDLDVKESEDLRVVNDEIIKENNDFKNKIKSLKEQLQNAEYEKDNSKNEKEKIEKELNSLRNKFKQSTGGRELNSGKTGCTELNTTIVELNGEIKKLEEDLMACKATNSKLIEENNELHNRMLKQIKAGKNVNIGEANDKLHETKLTSKDENNCTCIEGTCKRTCLKTFFDNELLKKQNIIESLQKSLDGCNKTLGECEKELNYLREENDSIRKENDNLNLELSKLGELKEDDDVVKSKLAKARNDLDEIQKMNEEITKQNKFLENELKQTKDNFEKNVQMLDHVQKDTIGLQEQVKKYKKLSSQLEEEKKSASPASVDMEEIKLLKKTLEQCQLKNRKLLEDINDFKAYVQKLNNRIADLENEREMLKSIQQDISNNLRKDADCDSECSTSPENTEQLRMALEEIGTKYKKVMEDNEGLRAYDQKLKRRITDLETERDMKSPKQEKLQDKNRNNIVKNAERIKNFGSCVKFEAKDKLLQFNALQAKYENEKNNVKQLSDNVDVLITENNKLKTLIGGLIGNLEKTLKGIQPSDTPGCHSIEKVTSNILQSMTNFEKIMSSTPKCDCISIISSIFDIENDGNSFPNYSNILENSRTDFKTEPNSSCNERNCSTKMNRMFPKEDSDTKSSDSVHKKIVNLPSLSQQSLIENCVSDCKSNKKSDHNPNDTITTPRNTRLIGEDLSDTNFISNTNYFNCSLSDDVEETKSLKETENESEAKRNASDSR